MTQLSHNDLGKREYEFCPWDVSPWRPQLHYCMDMTAYFWSHSYRLYYKIPANKLRNENVIITSKRRFDAIITFWLRSVLAVMLANLIFCHDFKISCSG